MSESIITFSDPNDLTTDPVFEWLQSLDDGTLFDCHDLAEIFGTSESALWDNEILEAMIEEYPKEVSVEKLAFRGGRMRVFQLRRVAPIELGGPRPRRSIGWKIWLKVLEFHRSQPAGSIYGYADIARAVGANEKYLVSSRVLDALNNEFADTTRLINTVTPGNRGPTRKLEVIG
jgi:alkylated DNA nucleotide flippase Atl1